MPFADLALALFAFGGAVATVAMFLSARAGGGNPLSGKMYGQIPLSARYASADATAGEAARMTKETN